MFLVCLGYDFHFGVRSIFHSLLCTHPQKLQKHFWGGVLVGRQAHRRKFHVDERRNVGTVSFLNEELVELGAALLFSKLHIGGSPSLEASERLCSSTSRRYSVVKIPTPKVLNMEYQGHHNIRQWLCFILLSSSSQWPHHMH